ncbi:MAG: D-alanyl-D-alanine carboxypeptidase, partial [Oscillospiraceae bacterium]|nr:D-alanyl-D-alanine carboxypeptidase [Oscillospiraceae bacterium]
LIASAAALFVFAQPCSCGAAPAPSVSARAALLADADSGTVIYSLRADEKMSIASTTKIMTALVVLERLPTDTVIEIKPEWTGVEGSSMYLAAGERYSVEQLLYGLMLSSGNDAAQALACFTAGSAERFADMMNEKSASLGMSSTHFTNPHGLDDEEHYSTARDLALLAAAAMKRPELARIVSTESVEVAGRRLENHNRLLRLYDGAVGIKTGYTLSAGRTLVGCAERGATRLICVTLDDADDWKDQQALFDWGFAEYETVDLSGVSCTVEVESGVLSRVTASCAEGKIFARKGCAEIKVKAPRFVYAPVRRGGTAGEIEAYADGEPAGSFELRYDADVPLNENEALNFWERLKWAWYYACRSGYATYPAIY